MTQERITSGNKLIAEFIGFVKEGYLWKHRNLKLAKHYPKAIFEGENTNSFRFHESWDWLMPVAKKIVDLGYTYEICNGYARIKYADTGWYGSSKSSDEPHALWDAVVDFIDWYNKTIKK